MGRLLARTLSADLARTGDGVKLVPTSAEVIHIDARDGRFVPPTSGSAVMAAPCPITRPTLRGRRPASAIVHAPDVAGAARELAETAGGGA